MYALAQEKNMGGNMRIITLPDSYGAMVNYDNTDYELEEDYHPFPRTIIEDYNKKTGCVVDITANPNIELFQRGDVIICPIFL